MVDALDPTAFVLDVHKQTEFGVAVGVFVGVLISSAALAFTFIHEKVKEMTEKAST